MASEKFEIVLKCYDTMAERVGISAPGVFRIENLWTIYTRSMRGVHESRRRRIGQPVALRLRRSAIRTIKIFWWHYAVNHAKLFDPVLCSIRAARHFIENRATVGFTLRLAQI
jgi:hypothetical protein